MVTCKSVPSTPCWQPHLVQAGSPSALCSRDFSNITGALLACMKVARAVGVLRLLAGQKPAEKALGSPFRDSSGRHSQCFLEGPNGIQLLLPQHNLSMMPLSWFSPSLFFLLCDNDEMMSPSKDPSLWKRLPFFFSSYCQSVKVLK